MPDSRPVSPSDDHPLPASQVTISHHADDAPRRRGLPGKLQRIKFSKQGGLGRSWSRQWLHPQRKAYIHAFFDATICWFMVAMAIYINCAAVLVNRIESTNDSGEFLRIHSYFQPVIAAIVGFAFGSLFKTVGECKGQQIRNSSGQAKKCIVIGQTRLPQWFYLCVTFVATFSLSFVASGGMKYVFIQESSKDRLQVDSTWCGVVTALCAASVLAVTADAIIRHRIFVSRGRPLAESAGSELPTPAKIELTTIV